MSYRELLKAKFDLKYNIYTTFMTSIGKRKMTPNERKAAKELSRSAWVVYDTINKLRKDKT